MHASILFPKQDHSQRFCLGPATPHTIFEPQQPSFHKSGRSFHHRRLLLKWNHRGPFRHFWNLEPGFEIPFKALGERRSLSRLCILEYKQHRYTDLLPPRPYRYYLYWRRIQPHIMDAGSIFTIPCRCTAGAGVEYNQRYPFADNRIEHHPSNVEPHSFRNRTQSNLRHNAESKCQHTYTTAMLERKRRTRYRPSMGSYRPHPLTRHRHDATRCRAPSSDHRTLPVDAHHALHPGPTLGYRMASTMAWIGIWSQPEQNPGSGGGNKRREECSKTE